MKRLTSLLSAELSCECSLIPLPYLFIGLYGIESDLLIYIACACTESEPEYTKCYEKLTALNGSPISVVRSEINFLTD